MDALISKLKTLNKGCHFLGTFAAALMYADDIAILAPSLMGLSSLLDACSDYCRDWDICLNAKKLKLLYFGKRVEIRYDLTLNGGKLDWADKLIIMIPRYTHLL